jgi:hypothetical protein
VGLCVEIAGNDGAAATGDQVRMASSQDPAGLSGLLVPLDAEMTEMLLLLPSAQAAALERAARRHGLTSAQLTRRLINHFLEGEGPFSGLAPELD